MTDPLPTEPSRSASRRPAAIVRIAALWLLAGALFKLLLGTPADLPSVVRDLPVELGMTYKLAILAELCIGFLALLRPRWGWLPLCAVFAVFDLVLTSQISAGEASCGCFGSTVPISPGMMLTIDSVLLVAILVTRPWSTLSQRGLGIVPVAAVLAVAAALPFLLDRQIGPGSVEVDGQRSRGAFMVLAVEDWVGQDVWDTPLGQAPLAEHIDVTALPLDGLWVFWRATCDHCARHLEDLEATETGERFITLVQLKESHDTEANRIVHRMPAGNFVQHASLPDNVSYILTTPADMTLEGGRIVAAEEGAGDN